METEYFVVYHVKPIHRAKTRCYDKSFNNYDDASSYYNSKVSLDRVVKCALYYYEFYTGKTVCKLIHSYYK